MPINKHKRHFHRIFFDSYVTLNNDTDIFTAHLVDISIHGCLLSFDKPWTEALDDLYTLKLQLSEESSIIMRLSVAHVVGNNVGFKCEHIDIDSLSQLRRLVELNLGDSDMLERDLLSLADLT